MTPAGTSPGTTESLQPTLYAQRAQSSDALSATALSALDVRYRAAPPLQSLGGYAITTADGQRDGRGGQLDRRHDRRDGLPVIAYVDLPASRSKSSIAATPPAPPGPPALSPPPPPP